MNRLIEKVPVQNKKRNLFLSGVVMFSGATALAGEIFQNLTSQDNSTYFLVEQKIVSQLEIFLGLSSAEFLGKNITDFLLGQLSDLSAVFAAFSLVILTDSYTGVINSDQTEKKSSYVAKNLSKSFMVIGLLFLFKEFFIWETTDVEDILIFSIPLLTSLIYLLKNTSNST